MPLAQRLHQRALLESKGKAALCHARCSLCRGYALMKPRPLLPALTRPDSKAFLHRGAAEGRPKTTSSAEWGPVLCLSKCTQVLLNVYTDHKSWLRELRPSAFADTILWKCFLRCRNMQQLGSAMPQLWYCCAKAYQPERVSAPLYGSHYARAHLRASVRPFFLLPARSVSFAATSLCRAFTCVCNKGNRLFHKCMTLMLMHIDTGA